MSEKKPCEWIIKDIDGLFCGMQQEYYEEVDCNQCYYKQLQSLKQENDELEAKIESYLLLTLQNQNTKLRAECDRYKEAIVKYISNGCDNEDILINTIEVTNENIL